MLHTPAGGGVRGGTPLVTAVSQKRTARYGAATINVIQHYEIFQEETFGTQMRLKNDQQVESSASSFWREAEIAKRLHLSSAPPGPTSTFKVPVDQAVVSLTSIDLNASTFTLQRA